MSALGRAQFRRAALSGVLLCALLACSGRARPGLASRAPQVDAAAGARAEPALDAGSPAQSGNAALPMDAASGAAGMSGALAGCEAGSGGAAEPAAAGVGPDASGRAGAAGEVPGLDETLLPAETADAEALARLAGFPGLPVLRQRRYLQQSSHDRGQPNAAEAALLPVVAYGNRDMNNFICKSADAQLGAARLIAYHFDQDRCAESYVHGVELVRYEGSGSLLRFWMTAAELLSDGRFGDELLRLYVDDDPRPLIQVPLQRVLDGSAGEIFATPFGAGSRYLIAWYYPVVFASKLVIALDRLSSDYYFQGDAALDAEPKPRAAAPQRLSDRDRVGAQLMAASLVSPQARSVQLERVTLGSAEQRSVQLAGPATIEELRLRVSRTKLAGLAAVRLAVRWDGAADPAIELPILDLFAASRSVVARSNLVLAASSDGDDQLLSLRLPMPFRTGAQWQLQNSGSATVDFQLEWFAEPVVPSDEFGYLNVQRREVMLPTTQLEQTFAQAAGRGRYVGLCADLAGHQDNSQGLAATPLNLLEGDVRAKVDGQLALDGTGSEDYPDNAFYFSDSPKATPFAQNWGLVSDASARPPGQVSFCRWQVLGNEIDFQSDFNATWEIAQHDTSLVELHRTMAFLYLP
jgi:hypothetical protein